MKIGLFGGAFNPVHNGHIALARASIKTAKLDLVIFIPSGNTPHKGNISASRTDRLEMLKRAIENEEKMTYSEYELNRDEISYSADTVEYFSAVYPDDELYFIIGDDSYNNLSSWHQPERILRKSTLLVFDREGANIIPPAVKVDMERVEISSSDIRERIYKGKDFINLLPKGVFDYIIKSNLYKDKENRFDGK